MPVAITSRLGPTHNILVESKRGRDYKSFSVRMKTLDRSELKDIMLEAVKNAVGMLSDEYRTGPDNDGYTHKIRLQTSITLACEQRYVMSKTIRKPYHSSEEVVSALKKALSKKGLTCFGR